MHDFEALIGAWHVVGEIPAMEPPMTIEGEAKLERLGEFIVFTQASEPAEVPDSIAIIGGAPTASRNPCSTSTAAGSSGCT